MPAAIAPEVLTFNVVPVPVMPPLRVRPPVGRTTTLPSVIVGVRFSVPRLSTVPPVKVLAAVRVRVFAPSLMRRTALPKPLLAMTEFIVIVFWVP